MNRYFGNRLAVFVFAFPALLLFTAFVIYPLFPEMMISLQNHDGFKSEGFVGLANYMDVLNSQTFWQANKNTLLVVALSIFVGLPISLMLALLMDAQTPSIRRFFKAAAVFPAVLSVTVVAQMWIAFYEPTWGLFNEILRTVGLGHLAKQWLTDKDTALISVAVALFWQYIGLNALLFYTGIKSIPKTYYEAALIDGAGYVKASIKITIPLLQDVVKYVLIISTLGSMALYAHVRIMTMGGPGDASRTIVYQMYYTAFERSEFGKGTATAMLFIIECLIISFLINRFVAREKIEI
ncbi:carbohydrate ABC transporter permease [Cohnella silvisoli]|uniref:Sugar ABC transporter permease n=1 Tax=Cohnella silvisoli TaxID=2873699 RepID=A0ABV1KX99_9BACL|nr:sugar ABC transporter permease [Cohnella silvisoli]MCD9023505.1 sugar ABC transporter permease [Cohnella silvisoli]